MICEIRGPKGPNEDLETGGTFRESVLLQCQLLSLQDPWELESDWAQKFSMSGVKRCPFRLAMKS